MMNYDGDQDVDISIGTDAAFYYPKSVNVKCSDEIQPSFTVTKNFVTKWRKLEAGSGSCRESGRRR